MDRPIRVTLCHSADQSKSINNRMGFLARRKVKSIKNSNDKKLHPKKNSNHVEKKQSKKRKQQRVSS